MQIPRLNPACMTVAVALATIIAPSAAFSVYDHGRGVNEKPSSPMAKISSELLRAASTQRSPDRFRPGGASSLLLLGPRLREDGRLQVYVRTRPTDAASLVVEVIERGGDQVDTVSLRFGIVQAWVKPQNLETLAELNEVAAITAPGYALPQVGSRLSEGDRASGAREARSLLKIDGGGVVVGVLADGVDSIDQAAATDDLPAAEDIDVRRRGAGDEGTAMLEIIHDLAPGAGLAFDGPQTSLEMLAGIRSLVDDAGARVIVDDLTFLDEPVFEDGMIAHLVSEVVSEGVSYHTAAGNQGVGHYERRFDGEHIELPQGGDAEVHEFGNDDTDLDISIAPMGTVFIVLQWDDRFGQSSNDYDLLIYDESFSRLLLASNTVQNGSQDPREGVALFNQGQAPIRIKALVRKFSGKDRRIEIHVFSAGRILDHNSSVGAVFGHAAVPGALAVGAVNAGVVDDLLANYSSQGPSRLAYPQLELRDKPDIVSVDGVQVSGAGGFPSPFFGTSAAAPHSAAVAALLMSAGVGDGAQVFDCITGSAEDFGVPGFDFSYGWGFLDAAAAAERCFPGLVCGDANSDGKRTATDALAALQTGVGAGACAPCSCDVNQDGAVSATDGLVLLQFGVGQDVSLSCPSCF